MHAISTPRQRLWLGFAAADAMVLAAAVVTAAWIRFTPTFLPDALADIAHREGFILYALAAQWALAATFDLYRPEQWRTRDQLLVRLVALGITLPVALALGLYFSPGWRFGRGLLTLTVFIAVPAQGLIRALWLARAAGPPQTEAVIVGDGPIVAALIDELRRMPSPPFRLRAHVRDPLHSSQRGEALELPTSTELVIVANLHGDELLDHLAALNFSGTPALDAAGAYAALTGRIPVRQVDSRWFIATGDFSSLATSPFHSVQRLLDVAIASALLVLTSPVLLLGMLSVLLSSGTPVLYRQVRLGRFKRPFKLLKLRTMRRDAEPNGPRFASAGDDRVLAVGRTLRRWRIDELPQLVNVLRGDMSMVGPRPERPEMAVELERHIPFYAFRFSVRPGLTGWAQVNIPYCAEEEDHQAKLEFDLYSLRHYGVAMYLMVLLRTLGALVFRPGR